MGSFENKAMDSKGPILTATNVHRQFQTSEQVLSVLRGVDLELMPAEMVAVTGVSGVGKSTLLHILGGLDRPTEGSVSVSGVSLGDQSEQSLARMRNEKIGFVFQFHYLLEDFSALENVMMPMLIAGVGRAEAIERSELMLQRVGLNDRKSHRPRQLSGGEQQRAAVARALANEPEVVLADEPSGNLDVATGRRLHELLFELNRENSTAFVIATHNRELAATCCRELEIVNGLAVETSASREPKR